MLNNDYMMTWLFVNSKVWNLGAILQISKTEHYIELKLQQTKFAICLALFNDFKLGTRRLE